MAELSYRDWLLQTARADAAADADAWANTVDSMEVALAEIAKRSAAGLTPNDIKQDIDASARVLLWVYGETARTKREISDSIKWFDHRWSDQLLSDRLIRNGETRYLAALVHGTAQNLLSISLSEADLDEIFGEMPGLVLDPLEG